MRKQYEVIHSEILLPPNAPEKYYDRETLWNSAEKVETQWNSQLARKIIIALPREIPTEQYAELVRSYCNEQFISKGMCCDFAVHDKGDGNPHTHIMLTMRAIDENDYENENINLCECYDFTETVPKSFENECKKYWLDKRKEICKPQFLPDCFYLKQTLLC